MARLYEGMTSLADKGFMMHADFIALCHELITPPKAKKNVASFSVDEGRMTNKVGSLRIHVERAFQRVQEWKVLHKTIKISNADLSGSVFFVCCMMSNFDSPLIRE